MTQQQLFLTNDKEMTVLAFANRSDMSVALEIVRRRRTCFIGYDG
ncbi:MAG: hypothetical protein OEY19_01690 [Gammaproteobacteria bacterium]|nr:hypothetical protein [Gammaproteobacteria bacterium]MDH5629384.1 hypothetical protein [Gammaproteobacteria bacterium]